MLAMSFTLGLAILAGAVATGLQSYLRAASAEQRRTLDRISLETAAAATLGRMAAGAGVPLKTTTLTPERWNGRTIALQVSLPEGKHDLYGDPAESVMQVLQDLDFKHPLDDLEEIERLSDLSAIWALDAAQEDCLRSRLTLGRAPEEFHPVIADGDLEGTFTASAGDQVDLRASLDGPSTTLVLWTRARFTGQRSGWKLHDYRQLTLTPGSACQP